MGRDNLPSFCAAENMLWETFTFTYQWPTYNGKNLLFLCSFRHKESGYQPQSLLPSPVSRI
jgi:hypothetical protein